MTDRRDDEPGNDRVARIVVLLDTLRGGGAERIAVEVAAALDRDRYSPTVVATREGGLLEEVLERENVGYTVLGRRRGFSPRKFRQARALLGGADLIHSHMLGSNLWGALFSRVTRVPLVAQEPTFSGARSPLRRLGYRWWISPVVRCISCPTPNVKRSLVADGVPPDLVEVIPNGVRTDAALPREEARARLGLAQDAFVVGIVAGLREEKAHEVLLAATARLVREGDRLTLCVVGDGVRRSALVEQAASLGLDGSTVWAGERADASALPGAFDVGVLCSDFEGLPVAALEILAAGVPMISTAVGTMPEILADGAGLTVPVRDDEALAQAVRRFLGDPGLREQAGDRAREIVRRQYSFEQMIHSTERMYERVLGGRA